MLGVNETKKKKHKKSFEWNYTLNENACNSK